ncbi:MAG: 50S ribosomal protein L23 [Bacillaceae bacterium G1]|nr:50S ribosomal protein L23 [Bacillota bacterium]OJF16402.1 MAG: 50S ribosomal protein L23 [Bacillaceae bacterium G1]
MKTPYDIIIRPIITERSTDLQEMNKYVFEVDKRANKTEIKQAIEQIFGVKVKKVNTAIVPRKPKNYGRYSGYTKEWKKAIVTLTPDSKKIEMFDV